MKRHVFVLAAFLSGCASPAERPLPALAPREGRATTVPPVALGALKGLSLERALALAEGGHPDLAAARARVEAARGRALQAGLFPNPELVARVEVAPIRGGTADEAEVVAGISQRVPSGGRLGAAVRVEELEGRRFEHEAEARTREVRAKVHAAFATALYAEEVVLLQADALRLAERGVAVTKARRDAGDALAEEVARAEIEEVRSRLEHERARSLRKVAFLGLASAMGSPEADVESLEGSLETALETPALEDLVVRLDGTPWAAAAEAEVAAERARAELARAERVPDVRLDLFYRRQQATETDAFDAGLGVAIPLFDRNQGRIREAEAGSQVASARARAVRHDLLVRMREAHEKLSRALAQARRIREEILPRAETVLKGAEVRYSGGDLRLPDLLPVRRDRSALRLSYLDSLREIMEAWAVLKQFAG